MGYLDYNFLTSSDITRLCAMGKLVFMNSSGNMYIDYKPNRLRLVKEKVLVPKDSRTLISVKGYLCCFGTINHLKSMVSLLSNLPCGYGVGCIEGIYYICHYLDDRGIILDYIRKFSYQRNMLGMLEGTEFGKCIRASRNENYYMMANNVCNLMRDGYSLEFPGLRFQRDCIHLIGPVNFRNSYKGKSHKDNGRKFKNSIVCRKLSDGAYELARKNFNRENFIDMVDILLSYEQENYALHWDRYYDRWIYIEDYNKFICSLKTVAFFKDDHKCQIVEIL